MCLLQMVSVVYFSIVFSYSSEVDALLLAPNRRRIFFLVCLLESSPPPIVIELFIGKQKCKKIEDKTFFK